MLTLRPARERGHADYGWLDTNYTFSFAGYRDPAYMGFRTLRVMNYDRVAPGRGFDEHDHRDMEIITVVLSGALQHRDSLGHGEVIRPGDVQVMTAGTGITHSEFNPSATDPVHLYQLWIMPDRKGHRPGYAQKHFPAEGRANRWQCVASPDGVEGSLTIHQNARVLLADSAKGRSLDYDLLPDRHAWLQVLEGEIAVGGLAMSTGDGVAISEESKLSIATKTDAKLLLIDMG